METPQTHATHSVSHEPDNPSEQLTVWLASRATDSDKSWEVQSHSGSARRLQRSSDPLQIPVSANGLQRLANRLANHSGKGQTGETLLALKIATAREIWPDDSRLTRWQVCSPGSPLHNRILRADNRDIADMKLLRKAGLKPLAVLDIHRLKPAADRTAPFISEPSPGSSSGSASEAPSECDLVHLLYLPAGTAALSSREQRAGSLFPSVRDVLHAALIAGTCAMVILTMHHQPSPADTPTPAAAASLKQLLDLCRPLEDVDLRPADEPADPGVQ